EPAVQQGADGGVGVGGALLVHLAKQPGEGSLGLLGGVGGLAQVALALGDRVDAGVADRLVARPALADVPSGHGRELSSLPRPWPVVESKPKERCVLAAGCWC